MIHEILEAKRDGRALSDAQIRELIDGIVDGRVTRPQAAAFLAFVFNQGMTVEETVALTMATTILTAAMLRYKTFSTLPLHSKTAAKTR